MALFGISGSHTTESCPLNNLGSAKDVAGFSVDDSELQKYKISKIVGTYHSALEHTFVWIVDADDPHLIEEFAVESGLASFNMLTIVPVKSLGEDVVPRLKQAHGL